MVKEGQGVSEWGGGVEEKDGGRAERRQVVLPHQGTQEVADQGGEG